MRVRVLGSAAGGGFPQWNCGCDNCRGVRGGTLRAVPRTQECVAVSADGDAWVLLNASPEIRTQLAGFSPLHPRAPRDSPVVAVVLTSGELDHVLGLLSLRESQPLVVYATRAVRDGFADGNALHAALARVRWEPLALGVATAVCGPDGRRSGLVVEAHAVPGKVPRHLDGRRAPSSEDTVALRLAGATRDGRLAYCPGAGRVDHAVCEALAGADAVFFDGTFWSDDELLRAGVGTRRAAEMAHVPMAGPTGSLAGLSRLGAPRRIFIHVNNTNPVLRDDGPERRTVADAGWEVAHDGLELDL